MACMGFDPEHTYAFIVSVCNSVCNSDRREKTKRETSECDQPRRHLPGVIARVIVHLSATQRNATWARPLVAVACSEGGSTSSCRWCTRYRSFRTCAYASCLLFVGTMAGEERRAWVLEGGVAGFGNYYVTDRIVSRGSSLR